MKTLAKKMARSLLPASAYFWLKKRHYLADLKNPDLNEEPDLAVVKLLVSQGDWVADIGANYGLYTTVLSGMVGDKGQVHSFEPIKPTFDILNYCVNKLNLTNVHPHHLALSDQSGPMRMEIPNFDDGTENYYEARLVTNGTESRGGEIMNIQRERLDSITAELEQKISFIKCDVEGHELAAIRGASETIKRSHPAWLIEIEGNPDDQGSSAFELFSLMALDGYQVYWYDGKNLRLREPGASSINYFFLTDHHGQQLQKQGLL